jgi:hypothetical protein
VVVVETTLTLHVALFVLFVSLCVDCSADVSTQQRRLLVTPDEVHLYGPGLHSIECSLRIKKKGDKNSNDRIEK